MPLTSARNSSERIEISGFLRLAAAKISTISVEATARETIYRGQAWNSAISNCRIPYLTPIMTPIIHLESIDEKSGIQAFERPEPNKLIRPRDLEKCEHEYIRHGTINLMDSFEVATGKVYGELTDTRGNDDFLNFIKSRVSSDPQAQWVFIVDQLNTHKSVDLTKYVAKECDIKDDLGIEKKRGIIKSMETRSAFI